MRSGVALILLPLATAALAADPPQAELPADVRAFTERRTLCDHFRGEEPYDAERRAFLEENLARYCSGSDSELAALKARYRNSPVLLQLLEGYEERVETDAAPVR